MVRIRKRQNHVRQNKRTKKHVEVVGGYYIELSKGVMDALSAEEGDELSVSKGKNDFGETELRFSLLK